MINRLDPMAGSHRALGRRLGVAGADADRAAGGTTFRSVHRPAAALVLAVLLWCCVLETQQTMDLDEADAGSAGWGAGEGESLRRQAGGANGRAYKGYDGYWLFDEEEATVHGGLGDADVVSKLYDKVSPCRYDGRICTRSKRVLSNPGEFVHDTGRQYCVKRTTVEDCDVRMRARGFAQRLDQYRPKPLELYPAVDGHTTTTFVAGTNFHGELGLGVRIAIQRPTIQTYFKLGDGLYEQAMGAGRGFKNLSLVSMGFAHSLGMDEQGVFYAWGANDFGQLGITSRRYPDGHRYTMLWPQPLPFFRPWRVKLCEGGLNNLRFCESTMLVPSFEFVPPTGQCALANLPGSSKCVPGFNQVSRRRNACMPYTALFIYVYVTRMYTSRCRGDATPSAHPSSRVGRRTRLPSPTCTSSAPTASPRRASTTVTSSTRRRCSTARPHARAGASFSRGGTTSKGSWGMARPRCSCSSRCRSCTPRVTRGTRWL